MAFAFNKWNENLRDRQSETKTLIEIQNGLELDLSDFKHNVQGHHIGLSACDYFYDIVNNEPVNSDSISFYYHHLIRDYISIQNKSGYESLKSKGLELVTDDSLRLSIISLYDYYYEIIEKLEEDYQEMQFHDSYFETINNNLADNFVFDDKGILINWKQPIKLNKHEKQILISHIYKIRRNRLFILNYYHLVIEEVEKLIQFIKESLEQ